MAAKHDSQSKFPGIWLCTALSLFPVVAIALINQLVQADLAPILLIIVGIEAIIGFCIHLYYINDIRSISERFPFDVSKHHHPVSERLELHHEQLLSLGFRRLGETDSTAQHRRRHQMIEWIYISEDNATIVELVDEEQHNPIHKHDQVAERNDEGELIYEDVWVTVAKTNFITSFGNRGKIIATQFPGGSVFIMPELEMTSVKTSLDAAYRYHLRQIAATESLQNPVDTYSSIGTYLELMKHLLQMPGYHKKVIHQNIRVVTELLVIALCGILLAGNATLPTRYSEVPILFNGALFLASGFLFLYELRTIMAGQDINKLKKKESQATK